MNDRSVSVLDNYDLEIQNITKGRNAYICETTRGMYILEEYKGALFKLTMLEALLKQLKELGFSNTDMIIRNKDGELSCKDYEGTSFIVKEYQTGRECSVKNKEELLAAIKLLGRLHNAMAQCKLEDFDAFKLHILQDEIGKHNRELKHIKRYLRRRGDKTEFERALLTHYDFFLEKALYLEEVLWKQEIEEKAGLELCHGDYQYHNILFVEGGMAVVHFENFHRESCIKDLYLFLRKVMEKYNWSIELWNDLLQAYQQERRLSDQEWKELYHRLSYPEKFWKIVNYYLNNRKSWQPEKNLEKLKKVIEQEVGKNKILGIIRKHID